MNTVTLPFLDHTGTLTPLVIEALADGATSDHHPTEADMILLTFPTKIAAKAFAAKIATAGDAVEVTEITVDPEETAAE